MPEFQIGRIGRSRNGLSIAWDFHGIPARPCSLYESDRVIPRVSSSLEAAFGPGDIVEVYTSQHESVAQKLQSGKAHIHVWNKSAAFDLENQSKRRTHRRAYLWMAKQYHQRVRPTDAALVWVSFDLERTRRHRKPDDCVLVLNVPRSELLLSMYRPWSQEVLDGCCLRDTELCRCGLPFLLGCPAPQRRETWLHIFELTGGPMEWQGVLDRIDPKWLVRIDDVNTTHALAT